MNIKQKQAFDAVVGSILIVFLRLPVYLLGIILRRKHSPIPEGNILFIKMQGGGSLLLSYPTILGIQKRYCQHKIILLTTPSVLPFAKSLNVFDEIILIEDKNLLLLVISTLRALKQSIGVDTVIDLEVYSRLTTVFSVVTCARNRIGFFLESARWRRLINTHLIFFNRFSCVQYFYEEIAKLLCAPVATLSKCRELLMEDLPGVTKNDKVKRISIGHSCSEMGTERMLTPEQWRIVFDKMGVDNEEYLFLGSHNDNYYAEAIIKILKPVFQNANFRNMSGKLSLNESISYLVSSDEFWGIDSSLLHYARLFKIKNISFWGPTNPMTRLKNDTDVDSEVYYHKVLCSPCIHVAEEPPCHGDNICIRALFSDWQPGNEYNTSYNNAKIHTRNCL